MPLGNFLPFMVYFGSRVGGLWLSMIALLADAFPSADINWGHYKLQEVGNINLAGI